MWMCCYGIYRQIEALSYISAHQLLIHFIHVFFETVQSFGPVHICVTFFLFLFLLTLFIIIIIVVVV